MRYNTPFKIVIDEIRIYDNNGVVLELQKFVACSKTQKFCVKSWSKNLEPPWDSNSLSTDIQLNTLICWANY